MSRAVRRFACGVAETVLGLSLFAGCSGARAGHDAVLSFGRVYVGEDAKTFVRDFGTGTRARRADTGGTVRDLMLYRHGQAVLGVGILEGRVGDLVAYERLPDAKVAREFEIAPGGKPAPTRVSIDELSWLGMPLFSGTLPQTPDGWRVPADFTVALDKKDFVVVDEDRMALKSSSPDYGWTVQVR